VPITLELRSIDHVGNASPVVAVTLTPEPELDEPEVGTLDHGFDICVPRIIEGGYARARNSRPDYHRFKEVQTILGAEIMSLCRIAGLTKQVRIRARFAYRPAGSDEPFEAFGQELVETFDVQHRTFRYDDYEIRGLNTLCEPRLGGKKEYVVTGTLTYLRGDGAVEKTHVFVTDNNNPVTLTCPTRALRQARRTAGWHYLKQYSVDYLTNVNKRQPKAPFTWLADDLGDKPYTPPGALPRRSWQPHHVVPANDTDFADMQEKMFNCKEHPNSWVNGVWLRWVDLRRTRKKDGSSNPYWEALYKYSPALANRTYHGDTFRGIYLDRLRDAMSTALQQEECPDPASPREEVRDFVDLLMSGDAGLGFPKN
jgi:hypothetical protein